MNKKHLYSFKDVNTVGIDKVPENSPILIEDSDGTGIPYQIFLVDKTGITGATTINTLLTTLTSQWTSPEPPDIVFSDTTQDLGAVEIGNIIEISEADYTALAAPIDSTMYVIVG